jgi:LPS-assembly protein
VLHVAIAIFLVLGTQQDQSELTVQADKTDLEGNVLHYTGNAVATYQDMKLEADSITWDRNTDLVTAGENIRYTRGEEHLQASRATVNIRTKAGDFFVVSGEVGPGFFISAQQAHRTEDGKYEITKGTVTSCCDGPRPGWSLSLPRAIIEPHERVTARGSTLRLQGVPVFYMPYMTVPSIERSRSTGFLIPSTSTSTTKGRSVRESFYWAINRSADATFTGEYFSKRGPAGGVEFRALPDQNSRIQLESLFAKDRLGQGGRSARIFGWGDLGDGYRGVADMNLVSSIQFRQVYEDGLNLISSPLEHSLAFASRNTSSLSTNFLYARNGVFLTDHPTDEPTVVLRKFPSVEIGVPTHSFASLPFYVSADTSFSAMSRRDTEILTPTFVERFDLHPTLELPVLHSSLLNWSTRLGVRETAYTHSRESQIVVHNVLNRVAFEYDSLLVGPQVERDFGKFRHVLEPSVEARYVGGPDRFQNTIVVDDIDLVTRTNEVEYALTNRFFTNREVFSWRVAQKYFFDPTFGGAIVPGQRNVFAPVLDLTGFAFADGVRRFSPVVSTMRFATSASTSTDVEMDYDTRDHLFRSAGIIGNANRGQFGGGVSYFFTRRSAIEIPNNQLRGTLTYGNQAKHGLSAAFTFSYDVQHTLFQGSTAQVGYNANCYGLSFEVSQFNLGARVESRFRFGFTLRDIGSSHRNIDFGTIRQRERLF